MELYRQLSALPHTAKQVVATAVIIAAALGVTALMKPQTTQATPAPVKQQDIPMTVDDFTDVPSLQKAIQQQIQGQPQAPQPQGSANMLQPTTGPTAQ